MHFNHDFFRHAMICNYEYELVVASNDIVALEASSITIVKCHQSCNAFISCRHSHHNKDVQLREQTVQFGVSAGHTVSAEPYILSRLYTVQQTIQCAQKSRRRGAGRTGKTGCTEIEDWCIVPYSKSYRPYCCLPEIGTVEISFVFVFS
eukprot:Gb_08528 [translate_table: standard]